VKRLFAVALAILGLLMCFVLYAGISTGIIFLKGGGQVAADEDPASFWVVTLVRAAIPTTLFFFAIVLLRKK
jgi:hypothetical protein